MGPTATELQYLKVGTEEEPTSRARCTQLLRLIVKTESRVQVHARLRRLPDWK